MIFKRLSKAEIAEGLTLDLVNAMDMKKNFSPVLLAPDQEPVRLLVCLAGFNVILPDGSYLRDEKKKLAVLSERECQLARARHLLLNGEKEKKEKTNELVLSWKNAVSENIDKLKKKIEGLEGSLYNSILKAISADNWEAYQVEKNKMLEELKPVYEQIQKLYEEGKFFELLEYFGIVQFPRPMLTIKDGDDKAWKVAKGAFSRPAIEEWVEETGGDMLNRYARIEIEKQYSI